jgi:hypothetical protein
MQPHIIGRLQKRLDVDLYSLDPQVHICDVGPDTYGHSHNPILIDKVWRWCRVNQEKLGIREHYRKL